jgi:ABC-type transport system substrate-binding protein
MGSPLREQMIALEIGQADVVELAADQARKAALGGKRVWSSAPLELLALVFSRDTPAMRDARLREALALSLDRSAMYNVLVQKQGEPAEGLLPQWLSGYAFLFATGRDLDRARKLVSELSPAPAALLLACDSADPLARAVAERIALNAREAGLSVKVIGADSPAAEAGSADVRLVRTRVPGVDAPASLRQLAQALGVSDNFALSSSATLEETYAAERALVESHAVIPLLHLPEAYALGPRTKNWLATRWDDWRLAEAWMEAEASEEKR